MVGRTRPRQERWARENCQRQGAQVYLPMIREQTIRSGRYVPRLAPLFPGYLFVKSVQWRYLKSTYGMLDVVCTGDVPSIISQAIIDEIQQRETEGLVQLPDAPSKFLFHDNDAVRVVDGPFAGKNGLFAGYTASERVRVLLDLLGRKVPVLLAEEQLELV